MANDTLDVWQIYIELKNGGEQSLLYTRTKAGAIRYMQTAFMNDPLYSEETVKYREIRIHGE